MSEARADTGNHTCLLTFSVSDIHRALLLKSVHYFLCIQQSVINY